MVYWYPVLGWIVFWIALVIAIIMFAKTRKFHPVMYLSSVALYIFTIGFAIDVFNMGKLGILSLLIFSAIIFIAIGFYFSRAAGEQ